MARVAAEAALVRPPWRPDFGPEWTRFPVARLRYTKTRGEWSLYWRDRNLKFHEYDLVPPTPHVEDLIAEIERARPPSSGAEARQRQLELKVDVAAKTRTSGFTDRLMLGLRGARPTCPAWRRAQQQGLPAGHRRPMTNPRPVTGRHRRRVTAG